MTKCAFTDCDQAAVGGFREYIDAGNGQKLLGMRTAWCEEHQSELKATVAGLPGRWLTAEQVQLRA